MTHEVLSHNPVVEEQGNCQLEERHSSDLEEALFLEPLSSVHSIILDWTSICFIDSVGAKAIKQVPSLFMFQLIIARMLHAHAHVHVQGFDFSE